MQPKVEGIQAAKRVTHIPVDASRKLIAPSLAEDAGGIVQTNGLDGLRRIRALLF